MKILSGNAAKYVGRPGYRTLKGVNEALHSGTKRSIRRLIKRDPSKGRTQPYYDKVTDIRGLSGLSGPSGGSVSRQHSDTPTKFPGARKRIRNRGTNTTLTKR